MVNIQIMVRVKKKHGIVSKNKVLQVLSTNIWNYHVKCPKKSWYNHVTCVKKKWY